MLLSDQEILPEIFSLHLTDEAESESTWVDEGASVVAAERVVEWVRWTTTFPQRKVEKKRRVEAIRNWMAPAREEDGGLES